MEIKTIEKNAYDIVVVGGGIAGVSAAGTAASLAIENGKSVSEINVSALQTALKKQGVLFK